MLVLVLVPLPLAAAVVVLMMVVAAAAGYSLDDDGDGSDGLLLLQRKHEHFAERKQRRLPNDVKTGLQKERDDQEGGDVWASKLPQQLTDVLLRHVCASRSILPSVVNVGGHPDSTH